ncbi:MAG: deaminase [Actinomycetota bacterium]|nr:deaminase [Actinomycetota bacterium]
MPPEKSRLAEYWDKPVSELVRLDVEVSAAQQERHQIFLLLLMALVDEYWNGFKKGRKGHYPLNDPTEDRASPYEYKGHNIAAIAVDRRGRVLDFGFNHNKLFNSSAEHAEARLVRRVFSLAHIADVYEEIETEAPEAQRRSEYDTLSEVTIYTSLESCAQCAGMMALGNVKQVVYLQSDPGMYKIGNILRNLSERMPRAPLPISAAQVGFAEFQTALEEAYGEFARRVATVPFWQPPPEEPTAKSDHDAAISSFLCTLGARELFRRGHERFRDLVASPTTLSHPDECSHDRDGRLVTGSLTNVGALENAARFYEYAITNGRRGTPHGI